MITFQYIELGEWRKWSRARKNHFKAESNNLSSKLTALIALQPYDHLPQLLKSLE